MPGVPGPVEPYDGDPITTPTGPSGENTAASLAERLRQDSSLQNTNAGAIQIAERLAVIERLVTDLNARIAALEGA